METIYITRNNLKNLPRFGDNKGNEAFIKEYNNNYLIKEFNYLPQQKERILKLIEKYYKELEMIPELLIFKKYIKGYDNNLLGILLDKGYSLNLMDYILNPNVSYNDLIIIFQNIGHILANIEKIRKEENKLTSFCIGDMHEENILVDYETKKIQFCDIDGCKLEDCEPLLIKLLFFTKTSAYVFKNLSTKYPPGLYFLEINQNTDLYCYNYMILYHLLGVDCDTLNIEEFYKKMNDLEKAGVPNPLINCFRKIYQNEPNENPFEYLDAIPSSFERIRKI